MGWLILIIRCSWIYIFICGIIIASVPAVKCNWLSDATVNNYEYSFDTSTSDKAVHRSMAMLNGGRKHIQSIVLLTQARIKTINSTGFSNIAPQVKHNKPLSTV